ncbi:MAG: AAA family ATPase [Deltaproteobacteria bacterium]|nr:AAA family ATPase [Deltaproteobacteria bacterium]
MVTDDDQLRAALDAPRERWIAFLHPTQKRLVEAYFNGPAKITGSAGTGKTVVAMHRARYLVRTGHRVLLTSFVKTLCANIEHNLRLLCTDEERERITVSTVHRQALELARRVYPGLQLATDDDVKKVVAQLTPEHAADFDPDIAFAEWDNVITAKGLTSWADYRKVKRTGRSRTISVRERRQLWTLFEAVRAALRAQNKLDAAALCEFAVEVVQTHGSDYDAVLVDEVQDLRVSELRLLVALTAHNPSGLTLFGDSGQRIYPGGFSLSALGINVRGRSTVLRINYRTTEQIRRAADRMIGESQDDMDEGSESRKGTRSILRGPEPSFAGYASPADELEGAVEQVKRWIEGGLAPEAIALFARTRREVNAAKGALEQAEIPVHQLADDIGIGAGSVAVGTMHRAKGLEFKAVLVVACTDKLVPFHRNVGLTVDRQDAEQALDNERRLLYVAMTRARQELRVTWHRTPSPFLADITSGVKK